jgi:hypothetical protein
MSFLVLCDETDYSLTPDYQYWVYEDTEAGMAEAKVRFSKRATFVMYREAVPLNHNPGGVLKEMWIGRAKQGTRVSKSERVVQWLDLPEFNKWK